MAYSHFMTLEATLKPGVTKELVVHALLPLTDYFGWTNAGVSDQDMLKGFDTGDDSIDWEPCSDRGTLKLLVHTGGEVTDNYQETLQTVGHALHDLVHATYFRLVNIDEPNPEEAESKIWIGSGHELEVAHREDVIERVESLLRGTVTDTHVLDSILDQIRQAPLPSSQNDQAAHRCATPSF